MSKVVFIVSQLGDFLEKKEKGLVYVIGDLVTKVDYKDDGVLLCRICCKEHGCDKERIKNSVGIYTLYRLHRHGYKVVLGRLEEEEKREIIEILDQFGIEYQM